MWLWWLRRRSQTRFLLSVGNRRCRTVSGGTTVPVLNRGNINSRRAGWFLRCHCRRRRRLLHRGIGGGGRLRSRRQSTLGLGTRSTISFVRRMMLFASRSFFLFRRSGRRRRGSRRDCRSRGGGFVIVIVLGILPSSLVRCQGGGCSYCCCCR